ncbi:MAG: FAD-binding oxidoreductase [Rhizobiales bacterium]|nr:FAD-binding oxidoreductase [Hyphomicrobiales bacterium]
MQNDPRSHGLWELTAPAAPETAALAGASRADVAVVGGGFTGLSTALHLAEAGANVTVLEAVEIGFGASGRNFGLVNAGMWVRPEDLPHMLGAQHGERLLNLLGNAPATVWGLIEKHAIACEPVKNGTLHCAVGKKGFVEIEERARQWKARGAPVQLLDATETATRIGSSGYTGSLLDLRAGTIQPLAYVRGLARAALAAGAKIYTGSPVTGADRVNGKWIVRTPAGSVEADWIVVATDAYTTAPWPEIRREQVHLPYFNLATKPLSANVRQSILPNREGAWDTRHVLSSFRLDGQGRLIFGSVGALRGTGTAIHRAWAKRAIHNLFPQLGDVEFESEWYGMIGMTDNHLPKFHRFAENVIGVCGYNGRGIAPGTVFGRVLAEHILGRISEEDLPLPVTAPQDAAFRAVKETYYELGAQAAHFVEDRV